MITGKYLTIYIYIYIKTSNSTKEKKNIYQLTIISCAYVIKINNNVGKFRPQLIKLISFKPKLLIRSIMNKSCSKKKKNQYQVKIMHSGIVNRQDIMTREN